MKRKILSLMLAAVMALGLAAPAMAYSTPDFSDVPPDHWAYEPVMKMADAGVIKGTGAGIFSPEMKLSAEMFVVLVGRVVFPDVKAEEADWSGPYVTEAKAKGLLEGTNITDSNLKGDISRYDMAVILAKCVDLLKVSATKADSSKVTDYGEIPTKYVDAVLMAYGSGLIRGDQNGSFNGSNSMTRQEAATVMDRLLGLRGNAQGGTTDPGTGTDPEQPTETPPPAEPEYISRSAIGWVQYNSKGDPQKNGIGVVDIPVELRYTEDNGATYTVIEKATTMDRNGNKSPGRFELDARIEKEVYDRYQDGKGQFYFSAEATVNGQHYVTQDRRTDGKATIVPITDWTRSFVDLVPSDRGETVDITVEGRAHATTYVADGERKGIWHYGDTSISYYGALENSTVKIYFDPQVEGVPRVLLGETTADGGSFEETFSIDTAYYRTTGAYYVVEVEAVMDGQICRQYNLLMPLTLRQIQGGLHTEFAMESDEYREYCAMMRSQM